jgi:hypothetical protein
MKIQHVETLISCGRFAKADEWAEARARLHKAIRAVDWQVGSGKFTIYPESGKGRRNGNGVKLIKVELMKELAVQGWKLEEPLDIAKVHRPGKLDAVFYSEIGPVAFEWEAGNISSSHRALNKMALGLLKGVLVGGVLCVPSKEFYQYLTDRVGNFPELEPYLDLWKSIPCKNGLIEIVVSGIWPSASARATGANPVGTRYRSTSGPRSISRHLHPTAPLSRPRVSCKPP